MRSDVGVAVPSVGSTFFPPAGPTTPTGWSTPVRSLAERISALPGLTRQALERPDVAGLQATLQEMCAQLGGSAGGPAATGELHGNGTARITSLVAVWLIGRVSQAYLPGSKLVKLSRVRDPDVLRSIGGVADLLVRAIRADLGVNPDE
ncbi:hypothetical protein KXD97_32445 (plasmid) [Mycobacterium sp. SMC-8]|uniref:hypothetical protein n=1 Tax=Mycobacterium sp. SMC-8 TaxID=2857060 RepID=UPI0021B302B9|nr:hypothetical protein [Mycobacterium sp. SMC-8]UXA15853.1 hypothetical protein KXD97_32445 [Mycobacterium sp. SMC-8]